MARFSHRTCLLSALVLLVGTATWVQVQAEEANSDDGVTVETVEEEDQYVYKTPSVDPKNVYLAEHFDDEQAFKKKWVKSEARKLGVDENIAKYDGKWEIQAPARKILKDDLGLVLTTEAKHAAISTLLDRPFEFKDKPLVVQYEVTMQEGQNCGGAYIKLLSKGTDTKADLRKFYDQTPYTIMFGPDKCGNDNKLHFIFRHRNPKNGSYEEKHSKKPSKRIDEYYTDKEPHLYTLIVRPDNTFSVLVDNKEVNSGSLLEDFTPPVNPPEEIDDPDDRKPDDWDEREKIPDATATKPADWDEDAPAQIVDPNAVKPDGWLDDEPETVPDPDAKKPDDWDEDMDGEWEAPLIDNPACKDAPGCGKWAPPLIPNPAYKGPWRAPLIANPNYKGKWSPRRIPNPHYFKDEMPFRMTPIHAVGFELWSMSPRLLFDNLIITDDESVAAHWAEQTFLLKRHAVGFELWSMSPRLLFDNLIITDDESVAAHWAEQTFLLKRAKLSRDSDSFLDRAIKFAGDNPWIYAVLILVILAFVGLVVFLCCGSKADSDADIKKTDAFVDDDQHHSEGEGEGDGEVEAEGEGEEAPERPSKADLEGPQGEPDSTETTPLVDTEGAGDGQRRRKPRKE